VEVEMLGALWSLRVVRGILLGKEAMFRDMVNYCEWNNVQPVVDDVVFGLDAAQDAYGKLRSRSILSRWSS
jgi:D-arabinose 1-dehydrogenase-like Zn-dependent alcohol dehydrogenase